ncbi:unnamed protein product [Vicia faba]|uniref:Rhodanese domain-containing protein n=1 Tax=Vicia faba TaxID=3906 RepID=A0AAV0ZF80_VICFA|nr:unnamed protein product [Vicia faba]
MLDQIPSLTELQQSPERESEVVMYLAANAFLSPGTISILKIIQSYLNSDPVILDSSQALLPADELKKRFEQEGISLEKPVVTSCGTGVTACILALGLHRLGKTDVPVYDGSWT